MKGSLGDGVGGLGGPVGGNRKSKSKAGLRQRAEEGERKKKELDSKRPLDFAARQLTPGFLFLNCSPLKIR